MDTQDKVGILLKSDFVDYPARIAAAVFLCGCNLRCPYCYNTEIVNKTVPLENLVNCQQILEHLEHRKKVLSGFVISGGEPLISPVTEFLIKEAKKIGYKVKLDTNGTFPEKLEKILENNDLKPDFIALDVKTSPSRYNVLSPSGFSDLEKAIKKSINLIASLPENQREYRTVLVPDLVTTYDIENIGKLLPKNATWKFARFQNGECLSPKFSNLTPYTEEEYQTLLNIALNFVTNSEIR